MTDSEFMSGVRLFIKSLDKEQREHFKALTMRLSNCYGDGDANAVLLFLEGRDIEVLSANADTVLTFSMLHTVNSLFNERPTKHRADLH